MEFMEIEKENKFEEQYIDALRNALADYQIASPNFKTNTCLTGYKILDRFMLESFAVPKMPYFFPLMLQKLIDEHERPIRYQDESLVIGQDDAKGWVSRHPLFGPYCWLRAKEDGRVSPIASYNKIYQSLDVKELAKYCSEKMNLWPTYQNHKDMAYLQEGYETSVTGAWFATWLAPVFDEQTVENIFLITLLKNVAEAAMYWEMPITNEAAQTRSLINVPKEKINEDFENVIDDAFFKPCVQYLQGVIAAQIADNLGCSSKVVQGILKFNQLIKWEEDKGLDDLDKIVVYVYNVAETLYHLTDPGTKRTNQLIEEQMVRLATMARGFHFDAQKLGSITRDFYSMYLNHPDPRLIWHIQKQ